MVNKYFGNISSAQFKMKTTWYSKMNLQNSLRAYGKIKYSKYNCTNSHKQKQASFTTKVFFFCNWSQAIDYKQITQKSQNQKQLLLNQLEKTKCIERKWNLFISNLNYQKTSINFKKLWEKNSITRKFLSDNSKAWNAVFSLFKPKRKNLLI